MSAIKPTPSPKAPDNELAFARRVGNVRSYLVIKDIMGTSMTDSLPLRVRCECSKPGCQEVIELRLSKRRELRRSYPRGFIIVPAHSTTPPDVTSYATQELCVVEKLEFTEPVTDL
jgi:hypothetical protein